MRAQISPHPQAQMKNAMSAFSILRRRYLSGTLDIYGFGSPLNNTRFGAYVQRVSDVYVEHSVNKKSEVARKANYPGSWNFKLHEPAKNPISSYTEDVTKVIANIIPWHELGAICFEWEVDALGLLKVKSISGYVSHFL